MSHDYTQAPATKNEQHTQKDHRYDKHDFHRFHIAHPIDEGLEIDSAPDACGVAEDLGVLPDDGSGITVPGNLWMQDDVDWYKIAATDSLQEDTEDGCDGFHFKVEITGNPTGNLLLDVYVDGCADANVDCKDDVIYEHNYNFSEEQQGQPVGQCPCSTTPQEGMTVCSADDKTFYIRVHGPADAKSCEPYELTITNGTPP